MDNGKQPPLTIVDKVTELKQPLSQAETALEVYNAPENLANVVAQASIDASVARIRYDAFLNEGFTAEESLTLVIEGDGGGFR